MSRPPPAGPFPSRDDGENAGPLTILVVEADPAVAERVRTGLNGVPGWGATVVRDAAAALAVGRHLRVDALVLELPPPGPSRLALLARWCADPNRSRRGRGAGTTRARSQHTVTRTATRTPL